MYGAGPRGDVATGSCERDVGQDDPVADSIFDTSDCYTGLQRVNWPTKTITKRSMTPPASTRIGAMGVC